MQKITINQTEISLLIFDPESFEISFENPSTGLKKVVECEEIKIKPRAKYVETKWICFDETPTGQRINMQKLGDHRTQIEDYNFFVEIFGQPIKKFAVNGLFREFMQRFGLESFAIFDSHLDLITDQPVPHPEPEPPVNEDDIDISDAFEE